MKRIILIFSTFYILLNINNVFGQVQEGGTPESFNSDVKSVDSLATFSFTLDERHIKPANDTAYDVGMAEQVNIDFVIESSKFINDAGIKIYRLVIEVQHALGFGIDFSDFYLPDESKLYAYSEDTTILLGAFTSNNNQTDNKFSIQPVFGTKLILEYNQYSGNEPPRIIINRISKIYRPIFGNSQTALQKSSNCYENIHCVPNLEVDRSVMAWFYYDEKDESYYVCSCALVNQDVSANDLKAYILTADHCGKNADLSTAVFYFNYQHSNCDNNNAYQYNYTMTGASKKAKRAIYDMFLLELYSFPPPDYNVHLSGWDRSSRSNLSDNLMGIHHPGGIDKKISLGSFRANTNPNFWRVEWDRNDAPTAKGSSGSPLFEDNNDRIIGWLSYGSSDCDKIDGIDRYGKFRDAWSSILGSDSRLRDWLDPNDNDKNQLDGRDPCFTDLLIQNRIFYSARQRYQPENKVTVQAGNRIETLGNVIIKNGSEHKFSAGYQIIFNTGFDAEAGSNFTAVIEPCELIAKNTMSDGNLPTDSIIKESVEVYKLDTESLDLKVQTTISAFPNPFKDYTTVEYSLADEDIVSVEIYDMHGTLVATLINSKQHQKGIYQINFDTRALTAGQYSCILRTSSSVKTYKFVKV